MIKYQREAEWLPFYNGKVNPIAPRRRPMPLADPPVTCSLSSSGFFRLLQWCSEKWNIKFNTVLDVGCGNGRLVRALTRSGRSCVGLDYAEQRIAVARRNCPNAKFTTGDLYTEIGKAGQFDLVTCFEVLEHLVEPREAIDECKKVGKFILGSVPLAPRPVRQHLHAFQSIADVERELGVTVVKAGDTPTPITPNQPRQVFFVCPMS